MLRLVKAFCWWFFMAIVALCSGCVDEPSSRRQSHAGGDKFLANGVTSPPSPGRSL